MITDRVPVAPFHVLSYRFARLLSGCIAMQELRTANIASCLYLLDSQARHSRSACTQSVRKYCGSHGSGSFMASQAAVLARAAPAVSSNACRQRLTSENCRTPCNALTTASIYFFCIAYIRDLLRRSINSCGRVLRERSSPGHRKRRMEKPR